FKNLLGQFDHVFSFLSEKEKVGYQNKIGYFFEIYQSFLSQYASAQPEVATHVYDIALATKGMILQSSINTRQAIMNSSDTAAIAQYEHWLILRTLLAQQYSKPIAKRRNDINELEEQAEKAEAELTRISATFLQQEAIGNTRWADVQKMLQEREVAIEFSSFRYRNDHGWTDSILYFALVLRPGDAYPIVVPLFEQKQLETLLLRQETNDVEFVAALYRGAKCSNCPEKNIAYGRSLYE